MEKEIAVEIDQQEVGHEPVTTHVDGRPVQKKDKTPTLIQNSAGSYKMVPKWMADELEKKGDAVLLQKTDPEYMDAFRLAVGRMEGFEKGELVQMRGKAIRADAIGAKDVDELIRSAEAEVAEATKGSKPGAIVPVKVMPAGIAGMQERLRQRRKKRGED